jgi:hypothetical protein
MRRELREILELLKEFSDEELDRIARAADFELQERDYRRQGATLETLGLIPLYRCQNPMHQKYGLYAEDPDRKGWLVCGCPKKDAEFAGYE